MNTDGGGTSRRGEIETTRVDCCQCLLVSLRISMTGDNSRLVLLEFHALELEAISASTYYYIYKKLYVLNSTRLGLSLSGACQEDVAASTNVRHAGLIYPKRVALPTPGQN